MTRFIAYASILACAGALVYGFAAARYITPAVIVGLLGLGWMAAILRRFERVHGLAFALFVLLSVVAIWAGLSPWLSLAGVTFSLVAWDLVAFGKRLAMTDSRDDARRTELAHFLRLGVLIGVSLLGFVVATRVHIDLTFGAAALLALLGIWGISALVYRLRSHE
jgi:hypothetical protein